MSDLRHAIRVLYGVDGYAEKLAARLRVGETALGGGTRARTLGGAGRAGDLSALMKGLGPHGVASEARVSAPAIPKGPAASAPSALDHPSKKAGLLMPRTVRVGLLPLGEQVLRGLAPGAHNLTRVAPGALVGAGLGAAVGATEPGERIELPEGTPGGGSTLRIHGESRLGSAFRGAVGGALLGAAGGYGAGALAHAGARVQTLLNRGGAARTFRRVGAGLGTAAAAAGVAQAPPVRAAMGEAESHVRKFLGQLFPARGGGPAAAVPPVREWPPGPT